MCLSDCLGCLGPRSAAFCTTPQSPAYLRSFLRGDHNRADDTRSTEETPLLYTAPRDLGYYGTHESGLTDSDLVDKEKYLHPDLGEGEKEVIDKQPPVIIDVPVMMEYNNCCLTVTDQSTPDPYVFFWQPTGKFYMTFTAGDRVEVWCSSSLLDFKHSCSRHAVWRPPPNQPYSGDLWAPELHEMSGRWYIYFAADHPAHGNISHRMYVIGGPPSSQDPCQGPWEFMGPLRGMRTDQWAIDGTVIHLPPSYGPSGGFPGHNGGTQGGAYFIFSGWPLGETRSDLVQELFIARMTSPTEVAPGPVRISTPDNKWEWTDNHGINEGPQWLASPDGSWIGIGYSCAGSWTRDYKMATLQYLGGDPLSSHAWRKSKRPLIQAQKHAGPFGPGHGNFLAMEGRETVAIFHATDNPTDGWNGRKARVQRVEWTGNGPHMGDYVGRLVTNAESWLGPVPGGVTVSPLSKKGTGGWKGKLLQLAKDKLREL